MMEEQENLQSVNGILNIFTNDNEIKNKQKFSQLTQNNYSVITNACTLIMS